MERATESLPVPEEPRDLKSGTRALLEESPEEGSLLIADAAFVSDLECPADVRWKDPLGAAHVQRLPFGADDHAGHVAVAGQPAGPRG